MLCPREFVIPGALSSRCPRSDSRPSRGGFRPRYSLLRPLRRKSRRPEARFEGRDRRGHAQGPIPIQGVTSHALSGVLGSHYDKLSLQVINDSLTGDGAHIGFITPLAVYA